MRPKLRTLLTHPLVCPHSTPEKRSTTLDSEAFEAMFQKDFHEQSQMNAKHHEILSQNEQLKVMTSGTALVVGFSLCSDSVGSEDRG